MGEAKESEKALALALAAEQLAHRVSTLTDAVEISNRAVAHLRSEVNRKPDDVELQAVAGIATVERHRQLKYAVITAILSSVVAGGVSTFIAVDYAKAAFQDRTRASHTACIRNNERASAVEEALREAARGSNTPTVRMSYTRAVGRLQALQADCDSIHPLEN